MVLYAGKPGNNQFCTSLDGQVLYDTPKDFMTTTQPTQLSNLKLYMLIYTAHLNSP